MKNKIANTVFAIISVLLIYQSIVQIRFEFSWWNIPVLIIALVVAYYFLQARTYTFKIARYWPLVFILVAIGIAITIQRAYLIFGLW